MRPQIRSSLIIFMFPNYGVLNAHVQALSFKTDVTLKTDIYKETRTDLEQQQFIIPS